MTNYNGAFSTVNGTKNIFAKTNKGRLRRIMNLKQYRTAKVNNEGERGSSRVHYGLVKANGVVTSHQ